MSRRVFAFAGIALLLAVGVGSAFLNLGSDRDAADLTVTWRDRGCVYDPDARTVTVTLRATGSGSPLEVAVTAYADENTSKPVGSATDTVEEAGTLDLTIRVDRAPHVDEDGVAACSLAIE